MSLRNKFQGKIDKAYVCSELRDYLGMTFGVMLFSFGWATFLLPYEIVTGGVTGICAIIFYGIGIPVSYTNFIINAFLLVVGLRILGFKFLVKTIYATLLLTVMLGIAQDIMTNPETGELYQLMGKGNDFMSLVIGCCITGISWAIVFLNNGSTGGTDIVGASINKYYNISLGKIFVMVDIVIIGSSYFMFEGKGYETLLIWRKIVFGLCTMFIETSMLDFVMSKRRSSVQFMIFTTKDKEISAAIAKATDHSVTLLDGHGWYSGKAMKVVCVLAKKSESQVIFRLIKIIDPKAFVSQSDVIGVFGEGFDRIKVRVKQKHIDDTLPPEMIDSNDETQKTS
ncbi:MAG: YitT family protein [Bacteroidota bacterium]|nr:YitT family protein [Bacteroidota bacterium]